MDVIHDASELHNVVQSIRKKYLLAKRASLARDQFNEEIFKPITKRLHILGEESDKSIPITVKTEVDQDEFASTKKRKHINDDEPIPINVSRTKKKPRRRAFEPPALVRRYLTSFTTRYNDTTYGVYKHDGKWYRTRNNFFT